VKVIVHAPAVHQGGGKTLLQALLQGIGHNTECIAIVDTRLQRSGLPHNIRPYFFSSTVSGRLQAERFLISVCRDEDIVFCMNSLPPLFPCAGRIVVYLQNRYLCTDYSLAGFPLHARVRISVERFWLRHRFSSPMRLFVQTPSMRCAAYRALNVLPEVMPFGLCTHNLKSVGAANPPRFLYPATPDPHKNHLNLFRAWQLLHQEGIAAELHVTIARSSPLSCHIERERASGVLIFNHGEVDACEMAKLYQQCSALIYPSKMESFGLPLLEAGVVGLPIVAAELDYVRDVSTPSETFDPDSPVSIARAVKRHLCLPDTLVKVRTPAEFIDILMTTGAVNSGQPTK
jgi:glycosyltransferase involved in cell wall biosynthesis